MLQRQFSPVAARFLCAIKGLVGGGDERARIFSLVASNHRAKAYSHRYLPVLTFDRLRINSVAYIFGERGDMSPVASRRRNKEFLSAITPDAVIRAQRELHAAGCFLQHGI